MASRTPSRPDPSQKDRDPPTQAPAEKPPEPAPMMGAFRINRQAPLPWTRAISTGLSWAIPILVGTWAGHLIYGLLAGMGALTYLYAGDEPYARRAVKLLIAMVALAFSFGAGALSGAVSFWYAALVLGLIGAAAVFLCGAFDLPPISALFFVFLCAIGTSMPVAHPVSLLMVVGLIFLGGIPAWLIAMAGWLVDPHGPETRAVAGTYRALAGWLAAVGTARVHAGQHQAATALRAAEQVLAMGRMPGRLLRLNEQADAVFLAITQLTAATGEPVDRKLTAAVRALADAVGDPDRACSLTMPKPAHESAPLGNLYQELCAAVTIAADEAPDRVQRALAPRTTVRGALAGALDRQSLIVPNALRYGGMLMIAHLLAYAWGTQRPFWVVLSTAAVMLGPSVTATLHRALQRTVGTIVGALLGALVLYLPPSGVVIALAVMLLQVLAQLMLVRNYAFMVAFITPLGFLIAHSVHAELATNYLVSARLVDILLGCALGVAGTMLIGRRASSKRLPVLLSEAVRREGRLVDALLTGQSRAAEPDRRQLRPLLLNLRIVYDAAVNELVKDRSVLESLWPAVIAVQRLGFFLIAVSDDEQGPGISRESLANLDAVFDTLASAVEDGRPPQLASIPEIPEYPVISHALHEISQGLQVLHRFPA